MRHLAFNNLEFSYITTCDACGVLGTCHSSTVVSNTEGHDVDLCENCINIAACTHNGEEQILDNMGF